MQAGQVIETASTIKVPILLALLSHVQAGQLSLRRSYRLRRDQVGRNGSGLLQFLYLTNGQPLYNYAQLMMSVSDNAATNLIIELLGRESINQYIESELGLAHTSLEMDLVDFPDDYQYGPDSFMGKSTPAEMAELMTKLVTGHILDPKYTRLALKLMSQVQNSTVRRQTGDLGLRRFVSKTGSIWMDDEPINTLNEVGAAKTATGEQLIFSINQRHPRDPRFNGTADAAERVEFAAIARALLIDLGARPAHSTPTRPA